MNQWAGNDLAEKHAPAANAILQRWQEQTGKRPIDVAGKLGIAEGELLRSAAGAKGPCTWLDPERVRDVIHQLPALGEVMALTRNPVVVHEKVGTYGQIDLDGHVGMVLNDGIDLRLFLNHWRHMVAVADEPELGLRASLQWFDGSGTAVHKVFLRPDSDRVAFRSIVASARADAAARSVTWKPARVSAVIDDAEVDQEALIEEWSRLEDTHEFQGLLRRHRVTREQALRLAPPAFAGRVAVAALEATLVHAAATALPIMVFVRNRGCVQIHSGTVGRIEPMDAWLNVLDPGFNLHVRRAGLARAWVVRKPTRHGIVSALECYDEEGDLVLTLFGARPSRQPEPEAWRSWIDQLGETLPPC